MGRHNNSDSKRFYTWLDNAQEDIIAAQILITNQRCYKLAAFHCQQTLEKVFKAYVLFKSKKLLDGHNLLWLCRQAMKIDKSFVDFMDESALINHYYIESRYPSDFLQEISDGHMYKIISSTTEVFEIICNKIDKEYNM